MSLKASREAVASALSSCGYTINRAWKFCAREERTPSAIVFPDGMIRDFGGSFHGDLADFLETFRNMQKGEALKEARRLLGLPVTIDFSEYEKPIEKKSGFISEEFIKAFEVERKDNFHRYLELLDQAMPALTRPQQKRIAQKYNIGYSKQADRLIMPIRDEEGRCVTLWKYNKYPKSYVDRSGKEVKPSKVTFTKGRERVPFNLMDLKKYREDMNGWVFLCEGEKDTLNALGRGYRAVTLGGAGERIAEKDIHLFKGLKMVIVYDYDEAGHIGVYGQTNTHGEYKAGVLDQLQKVAKEVKVWDWELLALQKHIELCKGYDFTDLLCSKEIGRE